MAWNSRTAASLSKQQRTTAPVKQRKTRLLASGYELKDMRVKNKKIQIFFSFQLFQERNVRMSITNNIDIHSSPIYGFRYEL
jgi:hypothetical protein